MVTDRLLPLRVACHVLVIAGCRPTVRPDLPPKETGPVIRADRIRPQISAGGREIVIGELCPQGAGGRPAVAPLLARTTSWTDEPAELSGLIERGRVPRFSVFGVDGKPAGVFDTVGAADVGLQQSVATGTYIGAPPCTADAGKGQRIEDPKCVPATNGCGVAVAILGRGDEPPDPIAFTTGAACFQGDALAVDIDGDGAVEQFALGALLDGGRTPATEWTAQPVAMAQCKPTFEVFGGQLSMAPVEPGKPIDPKHLVKLDVLGVIDVDGDNRRELILALTFPSVRTVVVYTATGSSQRLELAGEATSFTR